VLVAYAPGEREAAEELSAKLEEQSISLWEDSINVENHPQSLTQIGGIIDVCESVLFVASGAAATSASVIKQWRYARQQGKCAYFVGQDLTQNTESGFILQNIN